MPDGQLDNYREVIDAFLAAAREGDFEALLEVLDPDVVLTADQDALPVGASRVVRGTARTVTLRDGKPFAVARSRSETQGSSR